MQSNPEKIQPWTVILVFVIAFALTFFVCRLTLHPGVGPGSSGAWAADAVGAGSGQTAVIAPLFRLLTRTTAALGPDNSIALRLNYLTLLGHALFAGITGIGLLLVFHRWNVWATPMVSAWGGALAGISRLGWASGLLVNPAPWSIFFITAAFLLLFGARNAVTRQTQFRCTILSGLAAGIALALYLAAAIAIPAYLLFLFMETRRIARNARLALFPGLILPMLLFAFGMEKPIFLVYGLFVSAPGVSELTGLSFLGWAGFWALTPAALLFSLWGLVRVLQLYTTVRLPVLLLLICILGGAFAGGGIFQFAALLLTALIVILAIIGVIDLINRIPSGYAISLWLLFPVIWWWHGSILNRSGETIWETHVSNTIRTVRLNSMLISLDDELINAPYAYLREAKDMRPDLALMNPLHLQEPAYLDRIEKQFGTRLNPVRTKFDSLKSLVNDPNSDALLRKKILTSFLSGLITSQIEKPGVLMSPGFTPPINDYTPVAEGLFVRILGNGKPYPFHFVGLNLDEIKFKSGDSSLKQRLVAAYPMMFTARGSWMLSRKLSSEGIEYIRWALKIDPDYIPARIVARDYGIVGPPK
ncbi:hypothetical protein ACFLQJ_02255 [Calditrichota bacterium]